MEFAPRTISYEELLGHAVVGDCAQRVFTRSDAHQRLASRAVADRAERTDAPIRVVEDQKYYLAQTLLRHIPMTATQATRINADVEAADRWLSPRQLALLEEITRDPANWPVCIDVPLVEAW